ncbi:hypothetical protein ALC56_06732 [Trachymyrmex septentrionalis]|uniref:Uncharacterized protein n=1 Tax=Trachymyrmex septentrionalis TaxID=34720 RepID=A0A195FEA3_9HYME|nr:hypothetical protein ALC56_06732 [Trachymyrmex septentrionalis]
MVLREFYGRRRGADCRNDDADEIDDRFASTTSLSLLTEGYAGKRKNAMRMAPTGLHFQRPGSLNPVTYLSGQINEGEAAAQDLR